MALPPQDVRTEASDPWWRRRAAWVYASVLADELHDHDDRVLALRQEPIGTLDVPDGIFVAADPYVLDVTEAEPFVQRLGADTAEVVAVRAAVEEGHERIAALALVVGAGPVTDWVMATVPGQDLATLEDDTFFGYGVDAGTGSFGSPAALAVAARVIDEDAGDLEDPISTALFGDGSNTRSAVLVAPRFGAVPVAVCSAGWGDGQYPTWIGLDASGAVVLALTDFLLTTEPPAPEVPAPEPPRSRLRRWLGG